MITQKALIDSTELGAKLMSKSKRPGGVIVNQSAIFAIRPQPQLPIFSATKAAVLAATVAFSVSYTILTKHTPINIYLRGVYKNSITHGPLLRAHSVVLYLPPFLGSMSSGLVLSI